MKVQKHADSCVDRMLRTGIHAPQLCPHSGVINRRYGRLNGLLSNPKLAVEEATNRPEQFAQLRVLPGPALEAIVKDLSAMLFAAVLKDPLYEMMWLRNITDELHASVCTLVLDERVRAEDALDKGALADESQWAQLMALRGQLARGTFIHCLQMRARVNYGVSRIAVAKKRLAVPFRASNTPADRSEWKHPDVAITVTHLSYYYDGLSQAQFREALAMLLSMAESAQEDHYNAWLEVTQPAEEDMTKMDSVMKVTSATSRRWS